MRASTRVADGLTVVTLEGDLDKLTSDAARAELGRAVGVDRLLVDLSSVTFLDSAGLHVLFRLARGVMKSGGRLGVVVPAASPLRRVVEITNLESVALVCGSVEDGVVGLRDVSAEGVTGTGVDDERST